MQNSQFGFSNFITNLKQLPKESKRLLIIAFSIILLIVIGITVKIIIDNNNRNLVISNLDSYLSEAPKKDKTTLLEQIYNLIQDSLPVGTDKETFVHDAKIRDDTYAENTENGITSAHFLLDIDSLKMTYTVSFSWSDDKTRSLPDSIIVDCPKISDMKYPETKCYGMFNDTSSPSLYLPHTEYKDDGTAKYQITITPDLYIINIYTNACGDSKLKKEYEEEAYSWLKTTPIHYENYSLYYADVCNNETI